MPGTGKEWEKHQRREINRFLRQNTRLENSGQVCVPAYPGSMLFNHIAVLSATDRPCVPTFGAPRFESLDAVYESLSYTDSRFFPDSSILLDCPVWRSEIEELLVAELDQWTRSHGGRASIVILSGPHRVRLERMCNRMSLEPVVIKAQWWNAASMLHLYRSVSRVVFVDTARSLDAAMIGVECSLIASSEFSQSPVSSVLFSALSRLSCCRQQHPLTSEHEISASEVKAIGTIPAGLLVVENSEVALQTALGLGSTDGRASAVIRADAFWQNRWNNKLGNLRVSSRRKARKLVEDPRAFFADSKFPGSNAIATVMPARTGMDSLPVVGSEKEPLAKVNKRST